jgi:hypothetical protein
MSHLSARDVRFCLLQSIDKAGDGEEFSGCLFRFALLEVREKVIRYPQSCFREPVHALLEPASHVCNRHQVAPHRSLSI